MATVAITPSQMSADTGVVVTPGAGTANVAAKTKKIARRRDGISSRL